MLIKPDWYIKEKADMRGPFSSLEIYNMFITNKLPVDALIWNNEQADWLDYISWQDNCLPIIKEYLAAENKKWTIRIGTLTLEDLTYVEAIQTLLDPELEIVQVYNETTKAFEPITGYNVLTIPIYQNRRKQKRLPATGSITLKLQGHKSSLFCALKDISLGGVGVKYQAVSYIQKNQIYDFNVTCKELDFDFSGVGKIVAIYKSKDLIGIEFMELYDDGIQLIQKYLKDRGS